MMKRLAALLLPLVAFGCGSDTDGFSSWSDLADELASRYALAERSESSVDIVFEYSDESLVKVVVSSFESMGETMVDFACMVAPLDEVDREVFLRRNFQLGLGAYAIEGDSLIFRETVLRKQLRADELELYLHAVGSVCDEVSQELRGEPPASPSSP